MSLRKLFSENLQRLSRLRKSHAEVARAIGVNRQQYNNYLYGKNLPNEAIIERICAHFGVNHASLFQVNEPGRKSTEVLADCDVSFLNIVCKQARKTKNSLKPGWFHIIFRSPQAPYYHVVFAMHVRRRGDVLEFRRFSHIGLADSVTRFVSFHKGMIIEARENVFLISADIFDERSPSMLIGRPVISKTVSFAGKSLVRTGITDEIIKFAIIPVREDASDARHFAIARYHEPGHYLPPPEVTAVLDSIV